MWPSLASHFKSGLPVLRLIPRGEVKRWRDANTVQPVWHINPSAGNQKSSRVRKVVGWQLLGA